ncbi:hypothetical protein OI70_21095 [Dickeya fangzhongdai]|nr:hypothetical protein OI70_21095 [Dickeya fangzhongdai]
MPTALPVSGLPLPLLIFYLPGEMVINTLHTPGACQRWLSGRAGDAAKGAGRSLYQRGDFTLHSVACTV